MSRNKPRGIEGVSPNCYRKAIRLVLAAASFALVMSKSAHMGPNFTLEPVPEWERNKPDMKKYEYLFRKRKKGNVESDDSGFVDDPFCKRNVCRDV